VSEEERHAHAGVIADKIRDALGTDDVARGTEEDDGCQDDMSR
jgi:hypothetical protein